MKTATFDNMTTIVVKLNRIIGVRKLSNSNTWLWLVLNFLHKTILISCCIFSAYVNCSLVQSTIFNALATATYMILSVVVLLSCLSIQILGWQYYKEMSVLRKNIADTDKKLMKLNIVIDHRNIYIWIVAICTASIFNGFAHCILYTKYFKSAISNVEVFVFSNAIHNIMIYAGGMVVLDFMSHVCWLKKNFKETNNLLKKFFIRDCPMEMEDWNNKIDTLRLGRCLNEWRIGHLFCPNKVTSFRGTQIMKRHLSTSDKMNILQQIRYIHLQLCVITRLMNKIFDYQIIFHSIVVMQVVISTLYYSYTQLVPNNPQKYESINTLCFYIFDAIYVWLKIIVTSYFCEKASKEAQQIIHIIHACSIQNSDIELRNELVQFCLQVSLSEMDRKDTHLFWLNDGFILESFGGIFTYLLIMIQWNQTLM